MKPQFKGYVDSGDLEGIRIALANEMMLDPRGESFIEMRTYAESVLPNLYDMHDGEALNEDQSQWNEDLLFATKNSLDDNFSRERLEFYYTLAQNVLHEKAEQLRQQGRNRDIRRKNNPSHTTSDTEKQSFNSSTLLKGIAIGGLIVGGSGLLMGRAVVATVGLVGALISGGMLYQNKNK